MARTGDMGKRKKKRQTKQGGGERSTREIFWRRGETEETELVGDFFGIRKKEKLREEFSGWNFSGSESRA